MLHTVHKKLQITWPNIKYVDHKSMLWCPLTMSQKYLEQVMSFPQKGWEKNVEKKKKILFSLNVHIKLSYYLSSDKHH